MPFLVIVTELTHLACYLLILNRNLQSKDQMRKGNIFEVNKMADTKTKVKAKVAEAPEKVDTKIGLCATCRNGRSCAYLGTAANPVHQCEEFDVETVGTIESNPQYAPQKKPGNGNGKEAGKLQGLCVDCMHSSSCEHTIPGGIWQCEMYE